MRHANSASLHGQPLAKQRSLGTLPGALSALECHETARRSPRHRPYLPVDLKLLGPTRAIAARLAETAHFSAAAWRLSWRSAFFAAFLVAFLVVRFAARFLGPGPFGALLGQQLSGPLDGHGLGCIAASQRRVRLAVGDVRAEPTFLDEHGNPVPGSAPRSRSGGAAARRPRCLGWA